MRICLVGPSYPFRGGLAHHTTLLYRHLRARHQVSFYAFKRQYPAWLFPGTTDRDQSEAPLQESGVLTILDSMNPLTWVNVSRRIIHSRADLVIIPWWTFFWAPQFWTIATLVKRYSAAKLLFICHNVVDHEVHGYNRLCSRAVLRKGDYWFVHSAQDGTRLQELLPWAPVTQAFHPLYDAFQDGAPSHLEARRRLGLHGETILFFGFVRPYKGLDDLLRAMPLITQHRPITLLVVGEFWEGREAFRRQLAELKLEEAVRVVDRYVPNEEVGLYFSAADLVVLPYVSGTGSGIAQIAYAFEKPLVATRVGSLADVVGDGETGYLVSPGAPGELAEAVLRFFAEERGAEFTANIRRSKDRFSWDRLVQLIEEVTLNGHRLTEADHVSCTPL